MGWSSKEDDDLPFFQPLPAKLTVSPGMMYFPTQLTNWGAEEPRILKIKG